MADYSGNDFCFWNYRWIGGRWMVGKCFDETSWNGPYEVVLNEAPIIQRRLMHNMGFMKKAKIRKVGDTWRLTLQEII